jgi:hypothetical protein
MITPMPRLQAGLLIASMALVVAWPGAAGADPFDKLAQHLVGTWSDASGARTVACNLFGESVVCMGAFELTVGWDQTAGGFAVAITEDARDKLYLGVMRGDRVTAEHRALDGSLVQSVDWDLGDPERWSIRVEGPAHRLLGTMTLQRRPPTIATRPSPKHKRLRISGAAACFLKDREGALAAYQRLDAQGRQFLRYVCNRNGITMP